MLHIYMKTARQVSKISSFGRNIKRFYLRDLLLLQLKQPKTEFFEAKAKKIIFSLLSKTYLNDF